MALCHPRKSARNLFAGLRAGRFSRVDPVALSPVDVGCVICRQPQLPRPLLPRRRIYSPYQEEADEAFAFWDYGPGCRGVSARSRRMLLKGQVFTR
jgi:hypothetical protein